MSGTGWYVIGESLISAMMCIGLEISQSVLLQATKVIE